MALSPRERAILDYERCWWQQGATKQSGIRDRLGMSPTTYYRRLGALAGSAEAYSYDPLVVRRVQAGRSRRRRARFEGRPAHGQRR